MKGEAENDKRRERANWGNERKRSIAEQENKGKSREWLPQGKKKKNSGRGERIVEAEVERKKKKGKSG